MWSNVVNYGGSNVTIIGGKGSDTIYNNYYNDYGSNVLFKYSSGDGNDIIYGFNSTSTLSIGGGSYSTAKSDDDVIVTVGKGKITLVGAAILSVVNIVAEEKPVKEKNSWTISGKTAKYGTSSKTLVTVKGVKSVDGLSIKDKVVTVSKSSLGTSKVTISGTGYTLKLGSDVSVPTTKKAAFSLSGSTATYKSSYKTAGYTLASDGKSISYTKATTAETLATIKGASSKTGLSVSGNKITLKKSALKSKVTVSGGYEFDFASDYKKATISGSSSGDTITTRGSNLSINGGKGNDTLKALGTSTTLTGGAGSDIFIYKAGKSGVITDYAAEDKISIAGGKVSTIKTSGSNVIFTVGSGTITVKGGKDKTITYIDDKGTKTYKYATEDSKTVTLTSDYEEDIYIMNSKLRTLDASAVELDLKIVGNKFANKIIGSDQNDTLEGGKANDTLTGNGGSDIFLYKKGDGNDLITDYAEEDTISITSDKVSAITSSSDDIIFTLASNGKITVTGGADKIISYVDSKGKHTHSHYVNFNAKGTAATLKSNYPKKKSFEPAGYGKYIDSLATINASEVSHGMNIVGNDVANSIFGTADEDYIDGGTNNDTIRGGDGNDSLFGNDGKDYLYGGEGNDTLWGGKGNDYLYGNEGSDIFIYNSGEGTDKIFGYEQGIDKIMILNGKVDNVSEVDGDVVFKVGTGKIVLDNAAGRYAEVLDGDRNILKQYFPKS